MSFNYREQLKESKKRCVEIVKPIISLRKDLDSLNSYIEELSREKEKLQQMISEHQNVQKNVPAVSETIEIEIEKLKEKLNTVEDELKKEQKRAKDISSEITEIEKYIAAIRPFYETEYDKSYILGVKYNKIYTSSDGELALTEQIILNYLNDDSSAMAKNCGLTIATVRDILKEIGRFV